MLLLDLLFGLKRVIEGVTVRRLLESGDAAVRIVWLFLRYFAEVAD